MESSPEAITPRAKKFTARSLIACLGAILLWAPSASAQSAADYHARADKALQSYLLKFWKADAQYLHASYPSNGSTTGYWTYANGLDAVLDGVERTNKQQYLGLIETFYLGQEQRGWFVDYYDDEAWMSLALIRAYDLTGDAKYLNKAKELYADIRNAWDTTCCGTTRGGIWWNRAHTQKATASNAGPVIAGVRLYRRTGDASYLSFAQQVYDYWFNNMVNTSTWQVADHFEPNGTKVWWKFTYNEGLMIGASVELYEATQNATYLNRAHGFAGFMVSQEVTSSLYGNVLYDGTNTGCAGDCHEFKGPGYRYLLRLYQKDTSKTAYYNVLKASADALWNQARNTTNDTFAVNWAGPSMSGASEPQQSAATAALNRFAQHYGAYPGSGIPSNRYEAENAVLHRLGLEANGAGFTGWGYVAGWNGDSQWIDFRVYNATAGTRTLTFRYAGGAGNASRLVFINGANAVANKSFPGTGSWNTYGTVSVTSNLPAGWSTVSLIYNSSQGSSNYLNLDSLTVN
ncbi:Serine O-acetyltransferase [Cystobacter fuscus DSM 2262]|uniref:Serine O-acetyltransferase n=1 Tax=Cystobacter fuscus (strain ATCC 25194 / DSM 2262 / NBRC 100088 / M29) TaxID=1242864 RepID=S9NXD9_CYSF2|nr:glycoside hydrolase family 76 protein [Cystobacter fuscus]EPX56895.1 Serine O-acetyltransferase [Cystobacter fuscus DSM 2262]